MTKKLNISKIYSVSSIIKKPMTTKSDLEFLTKKLGLNDVKICWLKDVDINDNSPQIINLGNPQIGGSHWVCIHKNMYFDPFGLPSPTVLSQFERIPLMIQNQRFGHCGSYCVLFLYYSSIDEIDQFYNMFNILR